MSNRYSAGKERRSHKAKCDQEDPSRARRKEPLAKYAETYGISYSRGGMRPRLLG